MVLVWLLTPSLSLQTNTQQNINRKQFDHTRPHYALMVWTIIVWVRARSHWVRIALITIKGFSCCARITVTLRFRAWRVWIEVELYVHVCNVPKRRPPSSYETCESVPNFARLPSRSGKSCSTSRKELKNCVSEAPSTRARGAAQNLVPLLRKVSAFENSSWQRTNLRRCNIDMLLTEKYLTKLSRRPPPPCEAPASSWQQPCAVSDVWLYLTQGNSIEKVHPWKRIAAIQNLLDRIGRAGAIITRSTLTRLMRKFMRIAMETVIVWVRIARF